MLPEADRTEFSRQKKNLNPLEHRFYRGFGKSIPSSLHLTNKADEHVAFRVLEKCNNSGSLRRWSSDLGYSPYGVVPPRSTCTVIMSAEDNMLVEETGIDLVLQISIAGDKNIMLLKDIFATELFFKEAKLWGHPVYDVPLASTPRRGETTSEVKPAGRPTVMQPYFPKFPRMLASLDAHPTEPWIVLGDQDGNVSVWNHESKTMMMSFDMILGYAVNSIKFHATRKWIVAVTKNFEIHVYDYLCVTQIQKMTSFVDPARYHNNSLGIHATKPYVVSASMRLWDEGKGWKCTRTFGNRDMHHLKFNPEDPNRFACAAHGTQVEVWSLDSPEPDYTLHGHSEQVRCVDFFKCGDRQYLISASNDCTAKIWDLEKRTCIHTIEGFMCPVVHAISLPGRPYLVTCSKNSTIQVWSSTNFRLKTTINFDGGDCVLGLVCLTGSRRIAIGQFRGISIVDVDDDDEEVASEGDNDSIVQENLSRDNIDDDEKAVASKGNNEDSVRQENPSRGNGCERWSWQKDEVTGAWTRVKVSSV